MKMVGIILAASSLTLSLGEARAQSSSPIDQISAIAAGSQCAKVDWNDRGLAPKAYMRGMAIVFARAVCDPGRADVKVVAAAKGAGTDAERTDALTWYDSIFRDLGMPNDADGIDTLRHAYALLIGLGMRESSGKHCVGRDRSANFTSADSAEAGIFQTSFGASRRHETMAKLFQQYQADQGGCLLNVFQTNVTCPRRDAETFGAGPGAEWQKLTKACPAFATEYAAVLIRVHGGSRGEFGPIRKKKAQVLSKCDAMLAEVQALVRSNPQICSSLK